MIVLNEAAFYSTGELLGIIASFCVSCIGIKVLTMKIKKQRYEKKQQTSDHDASSDRKLNVHLSDKSQ